METMTIKGIEFEIHRPRIYDDLAAREFAIRNVKCNAGCSIYDVYDRPSIEKVRIWNKWYNGWYVRNYHTGWMGVSAFNKMTFSISALYFEDEDQHIEPAGIFKITRDHNKLFLFN